jgi:hypothetical protein
MSAAKPHAAWFAQAQQEGLLPSEATLAQDHSRPWPVVLLTAFGAWVVGLPLLGLIAVLFGDMLRESSGLVVVGGIVMLGALALLRNKDMPLFIEQLSVPMLWAGTAAMGVGFLEFLSVRLIVALLALVVAAQAMLLPGASRAWLRLLLGAACMTLALFALSPWRWAWSSAEGAGPWLRLSPWMGAHLLAVLWLVWAWLKQRAMASGTLPRWGLSLEPFALGWAIAVLLNLAWLSGQTFLIPIGAPGSRGEMGLVRELSNALTPQGLAMRAIVVKLISCVLTAVAAGVLAQYFRKLAHSGVSSQVSSAAYAVGAVLVALAWFMPSLGAALLLAAAALVTNRTRLAVLAAVVAVWIIGGFYYSLAWPLAQKAVVMALAGALLAAFAWWAQRSRAQERAQTSGSHAPSARPWVAPTLALASAVLTLLVANFAIWQKEQIIAQGKPVFVRLAPVDPRSLMQGDYMALDFAMPRSNEDGSQLAALDASARLIGAQRPLAVGVVSSNGVVSLTRIITRAAQSGRNRHRAHA